MEKLGQNKLSLDVNNCQNLLSEDDVRILTLAAVFRNFTQQVLLQREAGQKNVRDINETSKQFWRQVDKIIQAQTGKNLFQWFHFCYFKDELGLHDVHKRLCEIIYPLPLEYSVFYKFISKKAFIETRTRSEGLYTQVAQKRLKNRQTPKLTPEQLSEKSRKGWEGLSPEKRSKRVQAGWETRRQKTRDAALAVMKLKPDLNELPD